MFACCRDVLAAFVILVTVAGCQAVVRTPRPSDPVVARKPGPPAHAPAHGYRRKHQSGPTLRYDRELEVYVVVGHHHLWFHEGWFIRIRGDAWEVSAALDGSWKGTPAERIPPGLRARHHVGKPKGRGRGAASRSR